MMLGYAIFGFDILTESTGMIRYHYKKYRRKSIAMQKCTAVGVHVSYSSAILSNRRKNTKSRKFQIHFFVIYVLQDTRNLCFISDTVFWCVRGRSYLVKNDPVLIEESAEITHKVHSCKNFKNSLTTLFVWPTELTCGHSAHYRTPFYC